MKNYLNNLLDEKGLENATIQIEGVINDIEVSDVVNFICSLDSITQNSIKRKLVEIDFQNGDVMHFFKYIAEGMVKVA